MGCYLRCVPQLAGVLLEGTQHILDVRAVELEKLALDYLSGLIVPGDSDVLTFGADGIEKMGQEADCTNHLLMHAVGANVAGQIASVLAGGMILNLVPQLLG